MVGLRERHMKRKRNFAGKVNKIAKMIVRIMTFEGLQPMVAEATILIKGVDQCTLEVEDSNRNWKITIAMSIILGFAAMA